jgi:hypothetical protein
MTQNSDRLPKMSRRRLFTTSASFALGTSVARTGHARRPSQDHAG